MHIIRKLNLVKFVILAIIGLPLVNAGCSKDKIKKKKISIDETKLKNFLKQTLTTNEKNSSDLVQKYLGTTDPSSNDAESISTFVDKMFQSLSLASTKNDALVYKPSSTYCQDNHESTFCDADIKATKPELKFSFYDENILEADMIFGSNGDTLVQIFLSTNSVKISTNLASANSLDKLLSQTEHPEQASDQSDLSLSGYLHIEVSIEGGMGLLKIYPSEDISISQSVTSSSKMKIKLAKDFVFVNGKIDSNSKTYQAEINIPAIDTPILANSEIATSLGLSLTANRNVSASVNHKKKSSDLRRFIGKTTKALIPAQIRNQFDNVTTKIKSNIPTLPNKKSNSLRLAQDSESPKLTTGPIKMTFMGPSIPANGSPELQLDMGDPGISVFTSTKKLFSLNTSNHAILDFISSGPDMVQTKALNDISMKIIIQTEYQTGIPNLPKISFPLAWELTIAKDSEIDSGGDLLAGKSKVPQGDINIKSTDSLPFEFSIKDGKCSFVFEAGGASSSLNLCDYFLLPPF